MSQTTEPFVPPEMVKSRRSMSIQSICDPLASSVSNLSDHDSEATLTMNDRMSLDEDLPKFDSLSPSEEQAIRALEDLRTGTFSLPSNTDTTQNQQDFLNRVQNYSLVNSAVRVWDQGKNYNRALKWGGEMVESVVGGVVQRLEPLEPFAVRQLDRVKNPDIFRVNSSLRITSTLPLHLKRRQMTGYPHLLSLRPRNPVVGKMS
jgi:hypothetical protein